MYDKNKHGKLVKEKQNEHQFSNVVRNSSSSKVSGRHGKVMVGYNMTSGRGFKNK